MKRTSFKLAGLVGLLLLAEQNLCAALTGAELPGSVQPGQVSHALRQQNTTTENGTLPPLIRRPEQNQSPLGPEAEKVKFKLNGIILEGNYVYSKATLEELYKNDLHKTITVAELFNIVQSITNFYRNNGYILTRAILPPQHVKNGVVHIQIVEGFIDNVTVLGNPGLARNLICAYGHQITRCRPLKIQTMERYMILANEIPQTSVKAVLSPSKTVKGAADLALVSDHHTLAGYLSYDNYGTRYLGPQQMTANVSLNSFIASGDAGNVTFVKTPRGNELTYWDANYNVPVDAEGTRLLIGGTRAETMPLFVLAPAKIQGLNNNYYTTLNFAPVRSRSKSLNLRIGFNYQDSETQTSGVQLYNDHLRTLDLGETYNFSDTWYGANLISADLRQGLSIMGYTSNNSLTAPNSRPGANANFTKVIATLSRLQLIKGNLSIYGIVNGQYSFNPLLSSEQFSVGGSQLGRGYDVAEIIGDKGFSGSLELRYDWGIGRMFLQALEFYAFYDGGKIWNIKNIPGTFQSQSITSTGLGARFYMAKYVSGNVMWAQPLTKQVAAEQFIGRGWRPRVFFSIVANFNS